MPVATADLSVEALNGVIDNLERDLRVRGSVMPEYEADVLRRQVQLLRSALEKDIKTAEKVAEDFGLFRILTPH